MIKIEFLKESGKPPVEIDAGTLKEALEIAAERRINLSYADLSGADLYNAFLRKIKLDGASLKNAFLRRADLSGAYLLGANLHRVNLEFATLIETHLPYADLRKSSLRNATLNGAFLRNACLAGAVLDATTLHGADLHGTDFSGADIDYSDLPLWCGSLNMKIDKRIFCQLLYHVMSAGQSVDDEEVRKLFTIPEVVNLANQFHRVNTCGELQLSRNDIQTTLRVRRLINENQNRNAPCQPQPQAGRKNREIAGRNPQDIHNGGRGNPAGTSGGSPA